MTPRSSSIRLFLASTRRADSRSCDDCPHVYTYTVPLLSSRSISSLLPSLFLSRSRVTRSGYQSPIARERRDGPDQAATGHCGSFSLALHTKRDAGIVSPRLRPTTSRPRASDTTTCPLRGPSMTAHWRMTYTCMTAASRIGAPRSLYFFLVLPLLVFTFNFIYNCQNKRKKDRNKEFRAKRSIGEIYEIHTGIMQQFAIYICVYVYIYISCHRICIRSIPFLHSSDSHLRRHRDRSRMHESHDHVRESHALAFSLAIFDRIQYSRNLQWRD